jgi:translation initiation factor IF-3
MNKKKKLHLINKEITIKQIRLTGEGFNGQIVTLNEALETANELNLDLVLISSSTEIGICKIMNYEGYIYHLVKKSKTKTLDLKEIKLGVNISENDLEYRRKHIIEFLGKGHRVKISLRLKGREAIYQEKAKAVILKLAVDVEEYGMAEDMPKTDGKIINMFIKPLAKK